MGFTIDEAYPSHVTKSNTPLLMYSSHLGQTFGSRFNTKNGAQRMTNVKKTTPSTFVAFCSNRMIRPCRDEFRDITLELREWWERSVVDLWRLQGDEGILLSVFKLTFVLCRSVTDRRSGEAVDDTAATAEEFIIDFAGVKRIFVLVEPLMLEPRLW